MIFSASTRAATSGGTCFARKTKSLPSASFFASACGVVSSARAYETEFGQLQLEQSTWSMPVRVEKIAREQLRMQIPGPRRIEVVPGEVAR